jgi:hypothetical protein
LFFKEQTMNNQAFKQLKAAIEAGGLTPDQMEDAVMAMDTAYRENHPDITRHMGISLRDTADEMMVARETAAEVRDFELPRTGYVHTVPNVEGVSLEVMQ